MYDKREIDMNIKFRKCELIFTIDDNTEADVSCIGEQQYIVTFRDCDIQKKTILPHVIASVSETLEMDESKAQKNKANGINEPDGKKFPSVGDIVEYFGSVNDLTHVTFNNTYLQEQFFGGALDSRNENNLYHKFADYVNKAKDIIAEKENGHWEDLGRVDLGNNRHPKAFKFVKNETKTD